MTTPEPTSPLVGFHLRSFERFLQTAADPGDRRGEGLQGAFRTAFPVRTRDGLASLEFVEYALEPPRYDEAECLRRGITLAAPLKATVRLFVFDPPEGDGATRPIRDIKEQECYFGEVPLMTARGTFVADGVERVLAPTIVPRAGALRVRTARNGTVVFRDAHGDALDLERPAGFAHAALRVRLAPLTPPGLVLVARPSPHTLRLTAEGAFAPFDAAPRAATAAPRDVLAPDGRVLVAKGQKLTARRVAALRDAGVPGVPVSPRNLWRYRAARDVLTPGGRVALAAHRPLHAVTVRRLVAAGVTEVEAHLADEEPAAPPAAPVADAAAAAAWLSERVARFDLGERGRADADRALGVESPEGFTELTAGDLAAAFAWLDSGRDGDDLRDRSRYAVAAAGELLAAHALRGLWAMARKARDLMGLVEVETLMPHDVLDARPLAAALRAALASAEALDQRNALASLRHLRRLAHHTEVAWPDAPTSLPPDLDVGPAGALVPSPGARGPDWAEAAAGAAPLVRPEAPPSPTDFEIEAARAAGAVTRAERDGRALVVDGRVLLVIPDDPDADVQVRELGAFRAGNDATSREERAAVADGARVRAGDAVAEGGSAAGGALALGREATVAFSADVPRGGARVAEGLLREGRFTSLHAPALTCELRDTAHGREELAPSPPDAAGDDARHLDGSGIAALGAAVRPGDILVGRRRPRAGGGWEGASFRSPAAGVVRDVAVFERRGWERSPRSEALAEAERALWQRVEARAREAMGPDAAGAFEALAELCRTCVERTYRGDELPPGVVAIVRVTLAVERPLAVGDALADRHGFAATVREFAAGGGPAEVVFSAADAPPDATRAEAGGGTLYLVKVPGDARMV